MQTLIATIQTAVADGATPDQKRAAVAACRTLLAALDTEPGAPLAAAPPAPASTAPSPLALLRQLGPDQALDLLIAKLRAAVPTAPQQAPPRDGFKVQLVAVPRGKAP